MSSKQQSALPENQLKNNELHKILRAEMRRASDVIAMLPDVKPRLAMKALKQAVTDHGTASFKLTKDQEELAVSDGWGLKTSPIGAQLLRALFLEGSIEQNPPYGSDISELEEYISTEGEYLARIRHKISQRTRYQARLAEIAANPDVAHPDELSPSLINDVFLECRGYGKFGLMKIAGLDCYKSGTPRRFSNSRKTSYPGTIYCWWVDETGQRQGDAEPVEILNRRNDPARNWGLGPE